MLPALSRLAARADALRDQLVRWAEINTGSDHLAGLERFSHELVAALRPLTPHVERVPVAPDGRVAIHARCRPEKPLQLLCSGHYDTVYPADSPFQHCTLHSDGRLQGPGVADMKGGLVILLAVLTALEELPHGREIGWQVLLTPDEEIGSAASRPLLERVAPECDLGLIFEPARENGAFVSSRMGTGIFTLRCHGRAAHAGRAPESGRNAILALAEHLLAVARLPEELPGVMVNVGRIRGGGTVNIVPDFAEAEINVRISGADHASAFLTRLARLSDVINAREGYRLETSGQFNRLPMVARDDVAPLWAAVAQAARELGGSPPGPAHVGGGSDGNLLQAVGLPCLDGLGPVGGGLHSPDEYIRLDSLVERAQWHALWLERLAAGELSLPRRPRSG